MDQNISQLDKLRQTTKVDCDTLDPTPASKYGPFNDCTSNQLIALGELRQPHNEQVLLRGVREAGLLKNRYPDVRPEVLAAELATIVLALRMLPHITGCVHVQTNPFDAFSTRRTEACALRLLDHVTHLDTEASKTRFVIKIPSTWEGLQACRKLEQMGIKTLATTLFSLEQAAAAAEARCRYIAPYLHDLSNVIQWPNVSQDHSTRNVISNAHAIQDYFRSQKYPTNITVAALTTPQECFQLAKINRMTLAPHLLESLAENTFRSEDFAEVEAGKPSHDHDDTSPNRKLKFIDDQEAFMTAFSLRDNGNAAARQIYAINEFCKAQTELQRLVEPHLVRDESKS